MSKQLHEYTTISELLHRLEMDRRDAEAYRDQAFASFNATGADEDYENYHSANTVANQAMALYRGASLVAEVVRR